MGMSENEPAVCWYERAVSGNLDRLAGHDALAACLAGKGEENGGSALPAALDAALGGDADRFSSWSGVPVGLRAAETQGPASAVETDAAMPGGTTAGPLSGYLAAGLAHSSSMPRGAGDAAYVAPGTSAETIAHSVLQAAAGGKMVGDEGARAAAGSPLPALSRAMARGPEPMAASSVHHDETTMPMVSPERHGQTSGPTAPAGAPVHLGRLGAPESWFGVAGASAIGPNNFDSFAWQDEAALAPLEMPASRLAEPLVSPAVSASERPSARASVRLPDDFDVVPRYGDVGARGRGSDRIGSSRSVPARGSPLGPGGGSAPFAEPDSAQEAHGGAGVQSATTVALRGAVNLDGRRIGNLVATGQTSAASLPNVGASAVNLRALPVFRGTSITL